MIHMQSAGMAVCHSIKFMLILLLPGGTQWLLGMHVNVEISGGYKPSVGLTVIGGRMRLMRCPACGGPMILTMKNSMGMWGRWLSYWTCLENKSTGCQDLLDDR